MSTDYSRSVLLGGRAAGVTNGALLARLRNSRVHLSAEAHLPGSVETLRVLVCNLRRWPIQLSVDPGSRTQQLDQDLLEELTAAAAGIDPDRPLRIGPVHGEALHLHVGTRPPADASVAGVPDGHGVRLRHRGHRFPRLNAAGTGLGAVLAAATLTGEAFKTVAGLPAGTFVRRPVLDFCPVLPGEQPGLATASLPRLDRVLLGGCGAIGTGIASILGLLRATGELAVVDKEVFEDPNVTSYSIGTRADAAARAPKVDLIATHLTQIDVIPVQGTIQDYIERVDAGAVPWPRLVLGGLDSVEARHDLQRLHADLTLDGSTGGPAGTTLALHEALPTGPCLRCYFTADHTAPSAEQRLHQATGLPLQRIARGEQPLTEADLEGLTDEQRQTVAPLVGKPVCGLINLIGLTGEPGDTYRPSAAFVAQQAACLVTGAWIARSSGLVTGPMRRIEYDVRFGPRPDQMTDERLPSPGCGCQTDTRLISRIRATRGAVRQARGL
ncbi:ThiF family adenylyltransferase [Actinacidiphila acidipaludis]|uniref:ThiF family adenylyltransferase n=1 Tax=Actinacidiphila acidipaludis TaxID=2873382 RepID=A0ABS7QLP0_9ACTN|nr:ThiF family adenylyltransferase [Streptomyces acidipaludis]MBY8882719.1 ThiF family adenylyltransferase [Streptomyces acidipaludis]